MPLLSMTTTIQTNQKRRKENEGTAWSMGGCSDLEPPADSEGFHDDIAGGEDGGAVPGSQWRTGEGSDTCAGD